MRKKEHPVANIFHLVHIVGRPEHSAGPLFHELTDPGADLAGMNSADTGRYIAFAGGVPLWDGERVVGGIGVSGGSAEQDRAAAEAGLAVFDRERES